MKRKHLFVLGAVSLAVGVCAIAANHPALDPLETMAWTGNRTLKVYGAEDGSGEWKTLGQLTYRADSSQYEGVFYLSKDTVFGIQVFEGDTQQNWIAYKSQLSGYFSSSNGHDGGNIVVSTDGVYQFWVSAKIEDYQGSSDGFNIWSQEGYSSGILKLGSGPYFKLSTDGGAHWSEETSTRAAWDNTTHRYKISRHFNKGDKFKLTDGSKYLGYNNALGSNFGNDESGNIIIKYHGTYSFFLGASYWFYDDPSYGWGDASSDDTSKTYYHSYAALAQSAADQVDNLIAYYIQEQAIDDYSKYDEASRLFVCAEKYSAARAEYEALPLDAQELFTTGKEYATYYAVYSFWESLIGAPSGARVISAGNGGGDNSAALIAGLAAIGLAACGAMVFLAKRRKEI